MQLLATEEVTVMRPVEDGRDPLGAPVAAWSRERVAGVLPQPGGTSDLGEDRPQGASSAVTFHWPRGYGRPLKGCRVAWRGALWRVVGDPAPYLGANVPGPFDMEVEAVRVDG